MTDTINWCNLKKNAKHIGEVSTSRADGSPAGAEILTSTNEVTGQVRDTLAGKFKKMDDAFNSITSSQFIVTNFGNWSTVAGQQIEEADRLKGYMHPDDSGDVYAVKGSVSLPITRPSTPIGDNRFYLASAVNEDRLKDITDSVNNLHTKREAIEWRKGLRVTDPLQLYVHEGVEYLPDGEAVPFITGSSFDAANWVQSEILTSKKEFLSAGSPIKSSLYERFGGDVDARLFGVHPLLVDNSGAINDAIEYGYLSKKKVILPSGVLAITRPIQVIGADQYCENGSFIVGQGRGKTIIKMTGKSKNSQAFAIQFIKKQPATYATIWNCVLKDFTLDIDFESTVTEGWSGIGHYGAVSRIDVDKVDVTGKPWRSFWFDTSYFCSWTNMMLYGVNDGLIVWNSGTTLNIDNVGVYGTSNRAYRLSGNYNTIGSIFFEDCSGIGLELNYFGGTISSTGCENPGSKKLTKVIKSAASMCKIGVLYHQNVNIDDPDYRIITTRIGSNIEVSRIRIADPVNKGKKVKGSLLDQYDGDVVLGNINSDVNFEESNDPRTNDASLELNPRNATGISYSRGNRRPFIGAQQDFWKGLYGTLGVNGGVVKSIFLDAYGSHTRGGLDGSTGYGYTIPPNTGDWFIENAPQINGVAGYVCIFKGSDTNTSKSAPILLGNIISNESERPNNPAIGAVCLRNDTGAIEWWDGTHWRS